MPYTAYYPHENGSDQLYLQPVSGSWSPDSIVVGDNSLRDKVYVFPGLMDGASYWLTIQSGSEPVEADSIIGTVDDLSLHRLTGAHTVTIEVTHEGVPVIGAKVRVRRGAQTEIKRTNNEGKHTFNLDDGDWVVAITYHGLVFGGDVLAVSSDVEVTYPMTADDGEDDPDLSTVRSRLLENNQPVAGAVFSAELSTEGTVDAAILSRSVTSAITDEDGYAALVLVRSTSFTSGDRRYRLRMTSDNTEHWQRTVAIPDQSMVWVDKIP